MSLVITACTNRKRLAARKALRASDLEYGSLSDVSKEWVDRLVRSKGQVPAHRLYAGRGFAEAVFAAKAIDAELAVISAGLGVVMADTEIPSYALSAVAGSPDSILARLTEKVLVQEWWEEVCAKSPFSVSLPELIASESGIALVALSEVYLSMVAEEFKALPSKHLKRVRILTRASLARVDAALHDYLMPYDDRLDGPDSPVRGTRGDFANRAARHFAGSVLLDFPHGSADAHAHYVREHLAAWRQPPVFARVRQDDEQLLEIMREHWGAARGQSTRLLRVIRDDLNIACEQGRFIGLMNRLREERQVVSERA